MTIYLVIITTVLVITQIIRIVQNAVNLHRQDEMIKKQIDHLDDVTNEDIRTQKMVYRLLLKRLEAEEVVSLGNPDRGDLGSTEVT